MIRNREESRIKGLSPNEEKNGIFLTKIEHIKSRKNCREEK